MRKPDLNLVVDNAECPKQANTLRKLDILLQMYHVRTSALNQPHGFFRENIKNIYNSCVDGNVIDVTRLLNPPAPNGPKRSPP